MKVKLDTIEQPLSTRAVLFLSESHQLSRSTHAWIEIYEGLHITPHLNLKDFGTSHIIRLCCSHCEPCYFLSRYSAGGATAPPAFTHAAVGAFATASSAAYSSRYATTADRFSLATGDTVILRVSCHTAIDCHWLPLLRDLHSSLAVMAAILNQTDSVAPG